MIISSKSFKSPLPFDYYQIGFSNQVGKTLFQKIYTVSIEVFQNIYYIIFNSVALLANTLKLYKFKKREIYRPTKKQFFNFAFNYARYMLWAIKVYGPNKDYYKIQTIRTTLNYFLSGMGVFFNFKEYINNPTIIQKKLVRNLFFNKILIVSTLIKLRQTVRIVRNSVKSLKDCRKIYHKKPEDAMKYSFVHISNIAFSTLRLCRSVVYDYNALTGRNIKLFRFDNSIINLGGISNIFKQLALPFKKEASNTQRDLLILSLVTVFSCLALLKHEIKQRKPQQLPPED